MLLLLLCVWRDVRAHEEALNDPRPWMGWMDKGLRAPALKCDKKCDKKIKHPLTTLRNHSVCTRMIADEACGHGGAIAPPPKDRAHARSPRDERRPLPPHKARGGHLQRSAVIAQQPTQRPLLAEALPRHEHQRRLCRKHLACAPVSTVSIDVVQLPKKKAEEKRGREEEIVSENEIGRCGGEGGSAHTQSRRPAHRHAGTQARVHARPCTHAHLPDLS